MSAPRPSEGQPMFARSPRRLLAVLLASTVLVGVSLPGPPRGADGPRRPAVPPSTGSRASWTPTAGTSPRATRATDVESFDDWGLTIDAILALAAGGRGDERRRHRRRRLVEDNVGTYVTGADFGPDERYAGATAKTLLMAADPGRRPRRLRRLRPRGRAPPACRPPGADAGRFTDHRPAFGDFSNGFGQALAVMALARTGDGVPAQRRRLPARPAVPRRQLPRRLHHRPAAAPTTPTPPSTPPASPSRRSSRVEPTCAVRQAVTDAVDVARRRPERQRRLRRRERQQRQQHRPRRRRAPLARGDRGRRRRGRLHRRAPARRRRRRRRGGPQRRRPDVGRRRRADPRARRLPPATTQGVLALGLPSYGEIGAAPVDPGRLRRRARRRRRDARRARGHRCRPPPWWPAGS